MDIVFKFGNHYYGEGDSIFFQLFMSFIGAFFGFGFALLLYYLQNKRDEKSKEKEIQSKFKDQLQYFKLLLKGSLDFIEKQLNLLDEYIEEQKENPYDQKVYNESANNDINRLLSLDLHSIFVAYRENFKNKTNWIKEYTDFFHSLDFVHGKLLEVRKIYSNNLDQSWTDLLKVKDIIDQIPNQLSKYSMRIANELGDKRWENNEYKFLDNQIKKYRELVDSGAGLEKINKEYLEALIKDVLDNYSKSEFAEEILTSCKTARVKLNDIKNHMNDMLEEFGTVKGSLNSSIENLKRMKSSL